jgi:hypothetical protein
MTKETQMTSVDELHQTDLTDTMTTTRPRRVAVWIDRYGALRRFWITNDNEVLLIKALRLDAVIADEVSPGLFAIAKGRRQALNDIGQQVIDRSSAKRAAKQSRRTND